MHRLDIPHGNPKIVRSSIPHISHTLIFIQTNILIDADGHARIAGLRTALLPPATPGADIDRFSYGAAPELVDPQRFGLTDTGTTKASDVDVTWEVSQISNNLAEKILNRVVPFLRFSLGGFHSPTRVGCRNLLHVEQSSATPPRPP